MNWHEELLKRGFTLLESNTRTYGNGKITGSIVFEKKDKESLTGDGIIVEKKTDDSIEIFCPFIKADDDKKPNTNFQTVRWRTEDDLNRYLYY